MPYQVLVVEDSRTFRHYLKDQLQQAGFEAVFATTQQQAQTLLIQPHTFFCAVLDYCLPDAPNGEVIDMVLSYGLKSIVLTAEYNDHIKEQVLTTGVLDYLLKDNATSVAYLIPLLQRLKANIGHKALVVEDSPTIRRYICQLLKKQNLTVIEAENGEQALALLTTTDNISLIITDNDMPKKDGISMIQEIRHQYNRDDIAILGLSASNDHTLTAQFLKAGANDFLYKPFNQEEFYCRIHHMLNIKDNAKQLYKMANQDTLTGLWNRRYFFAHTPTAKTWKNIAMIDIDHFKTVNDTYGHDGGDAVLVTISKIIAAHFSEAIVARFGGEEFCIYYHGDPDVFLQTLELVRTRIETLTIPYQQTHIKVTISIGVTYACNSPDHLIKQADDKLYLAKQQGRNCLVQ
ncbi:diguanylate cyclase response regulator [Photobacterium aquimaris]|uniref:diguanylate cyclase n=1 Tax=Photobacterium aquimaris TaxID=512643 RepID=A0A2T3IJ69_9GAMM|nr:MULTISPECIES: response regulator [Photobacterium]OBU20706.1 diguanylate cyclase response regulator [Photobacterium aquimaris]PSU28396.1 diguanylate cyclase response regulator [Photobacterium aquimaris]